MSLTLLLTFLVVSTTAVFCNEKGSSTAFWKGTILDSHIERMRSACAEKDSIACFQYNAFKFLDGIFRKDYFQIGDSVEVNRNQYESNEVSSRSQHNLEDGIEEFIKTHDIKFNVPILGHLTVDSTSLDKEEIAVRWNFGSETTVEARKHKKSKLKKILSPIMIFILLKAITLVPFAIGVLGLKAWNGLQLAFISFIISAGLAIFQLCQKLAVDHAHSSAHIETAGPWDSVGSSHWARSLKEDEDVQKMVYSAHAQ